MLSALGLRRLGMLAGILRVLLGLGRIFLALGVVVAAVSRGRGTMRLCRGLVMFRRLIVRVFHFGFSHIGREISAASKSGLNSGQIESLSCFNRANRPLSSQRQLKSRRVLVLCLRHHRRRGSPS